MGLKFFSYLCLLIVTIKCNFGQDFDETDTVVIEAATEKGTQRSSRQIILQGSPYQTYNPFFIPQGINSIPLAPSGPCFTAKGLLGKCMSYRQCYPDPNSQKMNQFENWILGMYDTCSYYTEQGRQMFGVCCAAASHPTGVPPSDESQNGTTSSNLSETVAPYYPQISNWPPPIPTHPPDHTIPPLPTHPPNHGIPTLPTLPPAFPTVPTTQRPVWPPSIPTTQRPIWPPTVAPTKPTTTTTTSPTTTKSPSPPQQPPVASASCGAKNGNQDQERIVGGHKTEIGEWPWIAALFNGGRQFCGGSLIDHSHILSAAHCVAHMTAYDVARLRVRLGDHNINTNSEVRHIEKKVKRVVRHRHFDPRTLYNDIAILTLDSPVQFTTQVRPICLPNTVSDYAGKTATVIGWGSLREGGPQPSELQEVSIPVWSNYQCKIKYGPAAPGGIVEHMLCAGDDAMDSCSGDSGGPLMVNTGSGKWTQAGIVSWGIGCGKGQYPGVYTRVEKFLPWITKNSK